MAYTADGKELARYYEGENRTWVDYDQISPNVFQALVSTEDKRFFDHWGVDMKRTLSVPIHLIRGSRQGGSTVTQQLARNLYRIQVGNEASVTRKIKEILTAIKLEREFTKEEILVMYLNTVSFNYNAFGIEAAAQTYFNKPAAELSVPEAATLVGMLKGPSLYNPKRNEERARKRRNVVMYLMTQNGELGRADYDLFKAEPITLDFKQYSHTNNLAPHFAEILRLWLKKWGEENGYDLYQDGLRVTTTLDSRMQAIAQKSVDEQLDRLQAVVDFEWSRRADWFLSKSKEAEEVYYARMQKGDVAAFDYFWKANPRLLDDMIDETAAYQGQRDNGLSKKEAIAALKQDAGFLDSLKAVKSNLETGFIAIQPDNGAVRAWVGGRDYVQDKFDHVQTAKRQPGSTFKPFVYIAAIDNGYSPYFEVLDDRFVWSEPGQKDWIPDNAGGGMSGQYVTLRTALKNSMNIPTARVTQIVGPGRVRTYACRLGVREACKDEKTSSVPTVRTIGLGVGEVTLLEMTSAYATIANGGVYHEPLYVSSISDRYGNVIATFEPAGREALSANTAYTTIDMMRGVVSGGTAARIPWKFGLGDYDLAGKTGTTQESADGWFIMMHPDLVMGSWVGFNDRRVTFRSSWWGQGGHNALHVVGDFARRLSKADGEVRLSKTQFEAPSGYVVPTRPQPDPYQDSWYDQTNGRELDNSAPAPAPPQNDTGGNIMW